ncbi:TetR/AcrR family transcriptional regulator [Actinoplanes regularis]|uniref:Transcriptional regulator, TetR family n=1 Tax=Actinoplanes regularis TaxID=52697 RepID=A0A239IL06_9ACTN|nr:TetR/AcrR family transcriptional regulator [Actinoplanes regularis]GIE91420.1 TetR family transcriptional regulator [Actinoplanes regularis]SNS94350.1 transcriptional regulator, TetR family [Actinoplanes regularis]
MSAAGPRRRDSAATKQALLEAARRRFAADGYAATYIRDIAQDAGVNVALIARYFGSKEGLFRDCLASSADDLERSVADNLTVDDLPELMTSHLTGLKKGEYPTRILMLLRSSGDERAEEIRLGTLRSFAERIAAMTGSSGDAAVLDAQFVLAATLGLTILRSSGMQPLAAAGEAEITPRLRRLITAMLG